ncbi:MAG: hypothetical protein A2161_03355 [Candidatus Schekmanbacteria bacterium RBG_13_48_7]|uniref:HEAT repeat domain-containing protein n=1 Tax=Candidatus Schekmanbacteria bacterium RBG_13_48_7 TaxID=1817878 RepID=A0A1F7RX56_9BACT|nr:MAG: hypothetical protein A2161_03355 [Candidatus Schekmanbacteria bacterium RBG_13_48_7]
MLDAQKANNSDQLDNQIGAVASHGKVAVPMLIKLLDSSDQDQVAVVQLAMFRIGKQAEIMLADALNSGNMTFKQNALILLELFNSESSIPAVTNLLADKNPRVRIKAAGFLYKFKKSIGINFLASAILSDNTSEKQDAIQELIRFNYPESRNILLSALSDPDDMIKVKAIEGLKNLPGDDATLKHLDILRETSRSWGVRLASALAIYKITGNLVPYKNIDGREIFPGSGAIK